MSEAARLRATKAFSTDPEYIERLARKVENREIRARLGLAPVVADGSSTQGNAAPSSGRLLGRDALEIA